MIQLCLFGKLQFSPFANYCYLPITTYSLPHLAKLIFSCFANYSSSQFLNYSFAFFTKLSFSCVTKYSFSHLHVKVLLISQTTVLLDSSITNTNFKWNKSIIKNFIVKIPKACCKCIGPFPKCRNTKDALTMKKCCMYTIYVHR